MPPTTLCPSCERDDRDEELDAIYGFQTYDIIAHHIVVET